MVVMSEEFEEIFVSQVLPDFVARSAPSETPKIVFFGGQPGSGKTTSVPNILAEHPGVIHVEGDMLRRYHPSFGLALDSEGLALMPSLTDKAIGVWLGGLLEFAFASSRSILLEGTWWNAEQVLRTASLARDAGFGVEACLLAVSPSDSLVSLTDRFVGYGHFTRLWKHDRSVAGIPNTLEALLSAGIEVSVWDRSDRLAGFPACVLKEIWSSTNVTETQRIELAEVLLARFADDVDVQDIRVALLDSARFPVSLPSLL